MYYQIFISRKYEVYTPNQTCKSKISVKKVKIIQ